MNRYTAVIGRAEPITFLIGGSEYADIPAKVDTGAYSSSVWATDISEKNGELTFVLFDKEHPAYTGDVIKTTKYELVTVENSFGHNQKRYGVSLRVSFCGKKFTTFFTLSDRGVKLYPVLIGRKLLKNRFIVNVAIGHTVADEETEETEGFQKLKRLIRKKYSVKK